MPADPAVHWRLARPDATRIVVFDDEAMVFNPVSWETHLVNLTAAEVIAILRESPMSEPDLVAALLAAAEVADPSHPLAGQAVALLAELEHLGLAVRGVVA